LPTASVRNPSEQRLPPYKNFLEIDPSICYSLTQMENDEQEEVTLRIWMRFGPRKAGYKKIKFSASKRPKDGLRYFWWTVVH